MRGPARRPTLPSVDTCCGLLIPAAAAFHVGLMWIGGGTPGVDPHFPDSSGYIDFRPLRTAGYPLFLQGVRAAFGAVEAAPNVQVVLSAAAYAFLGHAVRRALGAPVAGLALVCALLANPVLIVFQQAILPDSLFMALVCAMTGALCLLAAKPSRPRAAAAGLACGLAAAVQPAGLSLLPIGPVALWFVWPRCAGRRLGLAAAFVIPLAACGLAENAAWRAHHGSGHRITRADAHVFAKALMLPPEPAPDDAELARFVSRSREALAPARALVRAAPDRRIRAYLLLRFESAATHETYARVLAEEADRLSRRRGLGRDGNSSRLRGLAGWPALTATPAAWASNAAAHYLGLWTASWDLPFSASDSARRRYNLWMDAVYDERRHGRILEDARVPRRVPAGLPAPVRGAEWGRLALAAGFAASVLALCSAAWPRLRRPSRVPDGRLVAAALAGLTVHGHFLVIGLAGFAQARYAATMFSSLAVCGLLLFDYVLRERLLRGGSPAGGTGGRAAPE